MTFSLYIFFNFNGRSSSFILFDFPETLNTMEFSFLINACLSSMLWLSCCLWLCSLGFSPLTISGGSSGPRVFPVYTCWLGDPISSYGFSHHQCPGIRSPHTSPALHSWASRKEETNRMQAANVFLNASSRQSRIHHFSLRSFLSWCLLYTFIMSIRESDLHLCFIVYFFLKENINFKILIWQS